jgi:hypothetical protein
MNPLTYDFENNNCHLIKYSNIKKINSNTYKIPIRIYETLIDKFEDKKVEIIFQDDKYIIAKNITRADIYNYINENYYFEQYYDYISSLTINSKMIKIPAILAIFFIDETITIPPSILIDIFSNAIAFFPKTFLRLNSVSPHLDIYLDDPLKIITEWKKIPRITNTIKTMLEYETDIYLIGREYIDIEPEFEFRCFVYKGVLTAISQYFGLEIEDPIKIQKEITKWWQTNKNIIPYEDCVMDICIVKDRILIIEFGPFGIDLNAGSCTYNWLSDYHILYNWKSKIPDIR